MANTSVSLGDHFAGFVANHVQAGHYKNVSEVLRAALRLLEEHEERRAALRKAIQDGIDSGIAEDWDPEAFLSRMRNKYGAEA